MTAPAVRRATYEDVLNAPPNHTAQVMYLMRCGLVGVGAEAALAVGLVVLVVALEPDTTWLSPSKARMWVAMRSRNQRSWLMTTAQPGKSSSASSSARSVSTSRSLVGSSSSSRLPPS
jgi:hypothetical protein